MNTTLATSSTAFATEDGRVATKLRNHQKKANLRNLVNAAEGMRGTIMSGSKIATGGRSKESASTEKRKTKRKECKNGAKDSEFDNLFQRFRLSTNYQKSSR